jgi:hypothetical protein
MTRSLLSVTAVAMALVMPSPLGETKGTRSFRSAMNVRLQLRQKRHGGVMSRFQNCCLPGLLLATLIAAGCAQSPTAPTTDAATAPGTTAAKPASLLAVGFYQMTFLNRYGQEITTLPVGAGSHLLVKVHVEDSNHVPAEEDGSALYEVCRWRGVSPTTGTRGGAAPSARCADGSARWERWVDIRLNQNGDAFAGIDVVNVACVMGWRVTYKGSRTIAPAVMGPADMTWQ